MATTILVVQMDKRRETAVDVQGILTEFGCSVKTRLGIHDGVVDKCSDHGLIILELAGDKKEHQALEKRLKALRGVKVKAISIPL